jgi:hypothetical protein
LSPADVATDRALAVDLVLNRLHRDGISAVVDPAPAKDADILVLDQGGVSRRIKVHYRKNGPAGKWVLRARHEGVRDPDLVYGLVDLQPPDPEIYFVPAAVVAEAVTTSHRTWLELPSLGARPHQDNDMRQVGHRWAFDVPGFDHGWLDAYRERTDLARSDIYRAIRTAPYRRPDENTLSAPRDPFEIDPDKIDRGLRGHARTQNSLFDWLAKRGIVGVSAAGDIGWDIAWRDAGRMYVAEVKSLTATNETMQLRLGLGQVLHYAALLGIGGEPDVQPVLVGEHEPDDLRWRLVCDRAGVILTWPQDFDAALGGRLSDDES